MKIIFTSIWWKGSAQLSFTTATLYPIFELSWRRGCVVVSFYFNTRLGEFMVFRFFLTVRIVNIDRWMEIILLPRAQHPLTRLYWTSGHITSPVRDEWSSTRLLDLIWSCWPRWTIRVSNLLDTIHVPTTSGTQEEEESNHFQRPLLWSSSSTPSTEVLIILHLSH